MLFIIALSGCSFSPLYETNSLSQISFVEPNKSNKDLHKIYMDLERLFFINKESEKKYTVTMSLEKRYDDIDVRKDEKVTRMGVSNRVIFYLKNKETEEVIFTGKSIASNAFNRISEPYSNEIAKRDSEERLAYSIAQDIRNQIVLFSKENINQ
mgnify:FL=1